MLPNLGKLHPHAVQPVRVAGDPTPLDEDENAAWGPNASPPADFEQYLSELLKKALERKKAMQRWAPLPSLGNNPNPWSREQANEYIEDLDQLYYDIYALKAEMQRLSPEYVSPQWATRKHLDRAYVYYGLKMEALKTYLIYAASVAEEQLKSDLRSGPNAIHFDKKKYDTSNNYDLLSEVDAALQWHIARRAYGQPRIPVRPRRSQTPQTAPEPPSNAPGPQRQQAAPSNDWPPAPPGALRPAQEQRTRSSNRTVTFGVPGDPPPYDDSDIQWEPGLDPPADVELEAHQAMASAQRLVERLEKRLIDIKARRVDFREWGPLHSEALLAISKINEATDNIVMTRDGGSQRNRVMEYYNAASQRLEDMRIFLSKSFDQWVLDNKDKLYDEPAPAPPPAPAPAPRPQPPPPYKLDF